ncbi:hypothetical protein F5Y03DRAFT_400824 [Xylaria venustula]|nr:hypothetical protein F5Y03DRAFT_400824 [Xylaria venustula]
MHRHRTPRSPRTPRTPRTPRSPRTPRHPGSRVPQSREEWNQLCEITIHRILRRGFDIENMPPMTSARIGAELDTGVVLIVSTGARSVSDVKHTDAGISEGLRDIAESGMDGRMILYGLAFHFAPTN